jgi:hypothetical protein
MWRRSTFILKTIIVRTLNSVNHCAALLLFGNHSPVKYIIKVEWFGPSLFFYGNLSWTRSSPVPSSEVKYKICRCCKFLGFYGSVVEISFLLEYNDLAMGKGCTTVSPSRLDLVWHLKASRLAYCVFSKQWGLITQSCSFIYKKSWKIHGLIWSCTVSSLQ